MSGATVSVSPVDGVSDVDDLGETFDLDDKRGEHKSERTAVDDESEAADHHPGKDAADHPIAPSDGRATGFFLSVSLLHFRDANYANTSHCTSTATRRHTLAGATAMRSRARSSRRCCRPAQ